MTGGKSTHTPPGGQDDKTVLAAQGADPVIACCAQYLQVETSREHSGSARQHDDRVVRFGAVQGSIVAEGEATMDLLPSRAETATSARPRPGS
jgi:hypothetical protein